MKNEKYYEELKTFSQLFLSCRNEDKKVQEFVLLF